VAGEVLSTGGCSGAVVVEYRVPGPGLLLRFGCRDVLRDAGDFPGAGVEVGQAVQIDADVVE
jgi:hypothetical protein